MASAICVTAGLPRDASRRVCMRVQRAPFAIEIVNIAQWRQEYTQDANAPGMPSADDSLSTTRLTLPATLPLNTKKVNAYRVRPEEPHWPLIAMTVLTQLSVGALSAIWLHEFDLRSECSSLPGVAVLGCGHGCAGCIHAASRATHLCLSRAQNVASFLVKPGSIVVLYFFRISCLYAGSLWMHLPGSARSARCTAISGFGGVFASAQLYRVPARPAWNSFHTTAEFFFTALLLGPLFVQAHARQQE